VSKFSSVFFSRVAVAVSSVGVPRASVSEIPLLWFSAALFCPASERATFPDCSLSRGSGRWTTEIPKADQALESYRVVHEMVRRGHVGAWKRRRRAAWQLLLITDLNLYTSKH